MSFFYPHLSSPQNTFDKSRSFNYKYYLIRGNHFVEARKELMQEYLNNLIFEIVKCIIYAILMDIKENLLAWESNTYNKYRRSMNFIQMVRFIHSEFEEKCNGDKAKFSESFRKQCCVETGCPNDEENINAKKHRVSDVFKGMDNFILLQI